MFEFVMIRLAAAEQLLSDLDEPFDPLLGRLPGQLAQPFEHVPDLLATRARIACPESSTETPAPHAAPHARPVLVVSNVVAAALVVCMGGRSRWVGRRSFSATAGWR